MDLPFFNRYALDRYPRHERYYIQQLLAVKTMYDVMKKDYRVFSRRRMKKEIIVLRAVRIWRRFTGRMEDNQVLRSIEDMWRSLHYRYI